MALVATVLAVCFTWTLFFFRCNDPDIVVGVQTNDEIIKKSRYVNSCLYTFKITRFFSWSLMKSWLNQCATLGNVRWREECINLTYPHVSFSHRNPHQILFMANATPPCDVDCPCSSALITPVCGVDNLTYLSPCFAGCKDVAVVDRPDFDGHKSLVSINYSN